MKDLLDCIKKEKLYMTVEYNPNSDMFTCDLISNNRGYRRGWGIGATIESAITEAIQTVR